MTKTKNLILEVIETPLTTARSEGKSRTAKEGNGRKGGKDLQPSNWMSFGTSIISFSQSTSETKGTAQDLALRH